MKARVLVRFRDKYNTAVVYAVGQLVDFDDERVTALMERRLVEKIEEPKAAVDIEADKAEGNDTEVSTETETKVASKPRGRKKTEKPTAEEATPTATLDF